MQSTALNIALVASVVVVGGVLWLNTPQKNDSEIVARTGLHWHPQITIYVKGERQEIPANIGLGPQYAGMPTFDTSMRMTAMHTHEPDGTIHLEFPARVTREDIMLGNFFRICGKEMRSFGTNMRMTVNGQENTLFESYIMRDEDRIELHYD